MSSPILIACFMDAPFSDSATPSPWPVDAVGGRPPHHPKLPFICRTSNLAWNKQRAGPALGTVLALARGSDPTPSLIRISSALTPSTSARRPTARFHSALRDLIPRCETSQGFCRLSGGFGCGVKNRFAAGGPASRGGDQASGAGPTDVHSARIRYSGT